MIFSKLYNKGKKEESLRFQIQQLSPRTSLLKRKEATKVQN